jgi:hypothetical protein
MWRAADLGGKRRETIPSARDGRRRLADPAELIAEKRSPKRARLLKRLQEGRRTRPPPLSPPSSRLWRATPTPSIVVTAQNNDARAKPGATDSLSAVMSGNTSSSESGWLVACCVATGRARARRKPGGAATRRSLCRLAPWCRLGRHVAVSEPNAQEGDWPA